MAFTSIRSSAPTASTLPPCVREAVAYARTERAKIVSLGGFSSILLEGNMDRLSNPDRDQDRNPDRNPDRLPDHAVTVFTTGNSLTVAFIVQGVEEMCALERRDLQSATLLIVGATGDVGSGVARCLAPRVKRVLLHARNPERLRALAAELSLAGATVDIAPDLQHTPARADLVICAASLASPSLLLDGIAPGSIVCDAGYPKNLSPGSSGAKIFSGGLGQVTAGMTFVPDIHKVLYRQPFPDVLHGCLLEGIALALERRFEPFSQGRGFITPQRVQQIEAIAARHGIHLAPLSNGDGPLESSAHPLPDELCLQRERLSGSAQVHLTSRMVGEAGLEPATTGLEGRCSIQLSYSPVTR
jgi:fatty aldehyde-generating acyl-ACP reductase